MFAGKFKVEIDGFAICFTEIEFREMGKSAHVGQAKPISLQDVARVRGKRNVSVVLRGKTGAGMNPLNVKGNVKISAETPAGQPIGNLAGNVSKYQPSGPLELCLEFETIR